MSTYSLWLIPKGDAFAHYGLVISDFSRRFQTPSFEPHITLIGDLNGKKQDMQSRTAKLATGLRPLRLETKGFGLEDYYVRSLYLRIAPSDELIRARELATKIFGKTEIPYMPHLSLLYSDLSRDEKQKLIPTIKKPSNNDILVGAISLWQVDGGVSEWRLIDEFLLAANRK